MPEPSGRRLSEAATARLMLLLLALAWGLNWPANKIVLLEASPWTFRVVGLAAGAASTVALVLLRGKSLAIPRGLPRLHVAVAGFFNVAAFSIFSGFALQGSTSSRVVILVYTMPIWAALLARVALGEALSLLRLVALALLAAGLAVLLAPHLPLPGSLWLALGTAWSWAAGTVYMKWAKVQADAMTIAAWQIVIGWIGVAIGVAILGEPWFVWPIKMQTLIAWIYSGFIGVGIAYFMWFVVIARLPAMTASLGALLIPIIGVSSSALLLGEGPTLNDTIGFALVFAAAACVLLQPNRALAAARAK